MIGLSGLITPSLDEMVHVAKEMQRQGFTIPLLIGGATTSRIHTAVKIDPAYDQPVVHVADASRGVGVVSRLLSDRDRQEYVNEISETYKELRDRRAEQQEERTLAALEEARANAFEPDWTHYTPQAPEFVGTRVFEDYPLEDIAQRIDWTPFFQAWQMKGKFPDILDNENTATEARKLYDDARAMLDRIINEKWLTARAVFGFFPAQSQGDDIKLYTDESRDEKLMTLHHLRQQMPRKDKKKPNYCLSDFVAKRDSGTPDWLGAFAVTAGLGIDEHVQRYEADNDDYSAIMLKALADRLAEAFAERLHERVRKEFWGFAADEQLDNEDLIKEKYQGVRPAPGYPACPDHSEKGKVWALLDPETRTGLQLTHGYAMYPTAAVSGWYFAHPDAHYFGTGKVGRDQVLDYAARKGMAPEEVESYIPHILGYNS